MLGAILALSMWLIFIPSTNRVECFHRNKGVQPLVRYKRSWMGLLLFNSTTPPCYPCAFSLSTVMWLPLTCSVELFLSKPHTSRESAPLPHVCNMCVCSSAHMCICVCVWLHRKAGGRFVCLILHILVCLFIITQHTLRWPVVRAVFLEEPCSPCGTPMFTLVLFLLKWKWWILLRPLLSFFWLSNSRLHMWRVSVKKSI